MNDYQQVNICTTEDLMGDAIEINTNCPFCDYRGAQRLGWVAIQCPECKTYWELEWSVPDIVRRMREKLKLTRQELSKTIGYLPNTIKQYEFVHCTPLYYEKIKGLFKSKVKNL